MIYIASEGMGSWGDGIILHLFKIMGVEAQFKNCPEAKILIRSMFFNHEGEFINPNIPYITWIGESVYPPHRSYPPLFELLTFNSYRKGEFILPYLVSVYFEMQTKLNRTFDMTDLRLDKNPNRPFMLAYCASNPQYHRDALFKLLQQQDSTAHGLGKCMGTPGYQVGEHSTWRDNWSYYRNYRFAIAMENKAIGGYVTEKLLNAILGGSIPIYYGDPTWVKQNFNEKAIIFVQDFSSLEECAAYILHVDKTPELLNQYQSQPVFVKKPELFSVTNPCEEYKKMCEIIKSVI
jgi:hypothetical protein